MPTRAEELKALARERDIVGTLDREAFTDQLLELALAGEDTDALLIALFDEGLEDMLPDFEEVEAEAIESAERNIRNVTN